jgi:hypothetical protein
MSLRRVNDGLARGEVLMGTKYRYYRLSFEDGLQFTQARTGIIPLHRSLPGFWVMLFHT